MAMRPIPLWANVTWFVIVLIPVARFVIEAVRIKPTFTNFLGLSWLYAIFIAEVAIVSGVVLYALVWLIDYLRGRAQPEELKADKSDVGNLVP